MRSSVVDLTRAAAPRLRFHIAWTFALMVLIGCTVAAVLLAARAGVERRAIVHSAEGAAASLSFGLDQEVAAVNYMLKGLSKSPALLTGDLATFYDQLKATPAPDGAWFNLNDLERQLINTLRPFGAALPKHSDFSNYQEQLDRIRDRRWTVSGRMLGLVKGDTVVALSLRLDDPQGEMTGFITTILPETRLSQILAEQRRPSAWITAVYDRRSQRIVANSPAVAPVELAPELTAELAGSDSFATITGIIEVSGWYAEPVLVAYRRSGATNWISAVAVPLSVVDAPIRRALWQMTIPAVFLVIAGGVAAIVTARQVEQPLAHLSRQITGVELQVTNLSDQLLTLQEDERRRIAQELHDSTAQHLVAAKLHLVVLEETLAGSLRGRAAVAELEALLSEALKELRVVAYLLHAPPATGGGLDITLAQFAAGFAERSKLTVAARIDRQVVHVPAHLHKTALRIVQEALTNVHRHAEASRACFDCKVVAGQLAIRITDDGRGMIGPERGDAPTRLGVGIASMRSRLEQFGGHLRIRTSPNGTSILAVLPLSPSREPQSQVQAQRRSVQARPQGSAGFA